MIELTTTCKLIKREGNVRGQFFLTFGLREHLKIL